MLYQPLVEGVNELRLITILPAEDGDQAAPVRCRLDRVSLQESALLPQHQVVDPHRQHQDERDASSAVPATSSLPAFRYVWGDYLALSYMWGDASITRPIMVNDETMNVTQNLEACLRVLREKDYMQRGWRVWIDALCINQKDVVERGREIKRMREIYSKAYTPIVWLGPEDESTKDALGLIERLSREYCSAPDPINFLVGALRRDRELFGPGRWLAMYDFVTRRYWSRMWILQEVAQGHKDTPILCGSLTVSWGSVASAFSLVLICDEVINNFTETEVRAVGREMNMNELWANLDTVKDLQMVQEATRDGQRLPHDRVLQLGHLVFATDPRDKIYGLLGLFKEELAKLIKPDYTASVRQVYLDMVKAAIELGSLDVLYHSYSTDRADFPSWLPDWSTPRLSGSPLIFGDYAFSASGRSRPEVRFLDNGRLLACAAILFDTIDGLGHPQNMEPRTIIQSTAGRNPYGNKDMVREAIWKAIACDRDVNYCPLTTSYECLLAAPSISDLSIPDGEHVTLRNLRQSNLFIWFVNSCKKNAELRVCGQPLWSYFNTQVDLDEINVATLRDALIWRDRIFCGRRLLTTEKGYVGVGLDRMQKGDVVAVLMGATMPVILRRSGEHYRFMGECYVHGIMHGWAVEELQAGHCQLEEIILC